MEVYFFKGMKGGGKVEDFSTAGARSHSRQETALPPVASILRCMWRRNWRPFERAMWRLFLSVFAGGTAALFGVASRGRTPLHGLGNSQKAEVAWLERKGYAYTEVEVDMLPVGDEKVIDFSPWDSSWFSRAVGQATCFWVWGDCAGPSPVSAKVSEQNESIRWLGDM